MLHCPFLLDAVGRGPLVPEGDVVRLTTETSGLSRMETLEQAISPMSKLTGPRSVGPTFPTRLPVTISKSESLKGAAATEVHRGRVFDTEKQGDTPGSFGYPMTRDDRDCAWHQKEGGALIKCENH